MDVTGMLITHSVARSEGLSPFFFTSWYFDSIKEAGNTDYCFYCGGRVGFRKGKRGEVFNSADTRYDPMKDHDPVTHKNGIIGKIHRCRNAYDWLRRTKFPKDFPFVVSLM